MEYQSFHLELKDLEAGTFSGHAAIFGNIDRGGDIIKRGAFRRSLKERKATGRPLKMMYRHREPIGVFTEVKEDAKGLFVKGRPLVDEVALAAEASALMRVGALDELSIGFETVKHNMTKEGNRELIDVELYEVSLVPFAMQPEARVISMKEWMELNSRDALYDALLAGDGFAEDLAGRIADVAWSSLHEDPQELSNAVEAALNLAAAIRGTSKE